MQTIYIISSGTFYRPIDTPQGKKGYVAEITFWYAPSFIEEKIPNVSKVFESQAEADDFLSKELHRLFTETKYCFRDYNARTKSVNIYNKPATD